MKKYLSWFSDRIGKKVLMTAPGSEPVEITIASWTHARLLHEDYLLRGFLFDDKKTVLQNNI